ncbi:MAG: hypothetical protein QXS85_05570 [Acidilobaceae archaeon]
MVSTVTCPKCGLESSLESFKLVRSPWRFRFYTVRMLECPRCGSRFRLYEGTSPRGRESVFTIPKRR